MYPKNYGNYVLLERIGVGGMSEIDLARRAVEDAGFTRFLVIKRIKTDRSDDESFVRMFKDEARISAELHHTNIAQVYDFGRHGDEYYLVLEYVPGVDVRRLITVMRDAGKPFPLAVGLRILCDMLEGLHYAHFRSDTFGKPLSIVHRDVNPRNIMVSIRGETKLIDFGVAKATDRLERTHTDHVKGKFAYMAPEQVAGKDVDHRADVFAAALTLHEIIAGQGPFFGLNQVQIMHRLVSGSIPELPAHPDLPDPTLLRRVQKKALASKAEERYPDAEAYRKDLERVAERFGGLATRAQVAKFVAEAEPELEGQIRAKMSAFSGPIELIPTTTEMPGVQILDPSGSLNRNTGSYATVTSLNARRAGVAAIGGAALVAGAGAVLLVAVLIAIAALWYVPVWGSVAAARVDDDHGITEANPTLEVIPPPQGVVIPPVVDVPLVETPTDTQPPPVEGGKPGVTPPAHGEEPQVGTADPVVTPDHGTAVAEPPPTVVVVANPPPDVVVEPPHTGGTAEVAVAGTLQVNSAEKGRAIYINGEKTTYTTPAKFSWPSGSLDVRVEGYDAKKIELRPKQFGAVTFQ